MATTQKLLIAGTHAGVGKTVVSAIVSQALGATYWKPIHCGSSLDTDFMREHTSVRVFEGIFTSAKSTQPNIALRLEGQTLKTPFKVPNVKPLVVEGLAGITTPIDDAGQTLLDAIHPMEVDVLLVAEQNGETINQVNLVCQNLQWLGFNVLGIIYRGGEMLENENMIEKMTGVRNKWHVSELNDIDQQSISKEATRLKSELIKWMK